MIKFNGLALPKWAVVTGVEIESANLTITEYEIARRVGNIDTGVNRGGITINLSLFIEPTNDMTILDQADGMKRFVMGDNWKVSQLILNEQPNKFYNARVSNMDSITDNFTHGETTIEFYCADPKKYDLTETVLNSSNGTLSINYQGMEKTAVLIESTITNSSTNVTFKHVESGREMTLLGSFNSTHSIEIDSDNRSVVINGEPAKDKLAFESNWIVLEAGTNTIMCKNVNGVTNNFKLTYREAN